MTPNIKILESESQYCVFNTETFNLFDINRFSRDVLSYLITNRNINETARHYQLTDNDITSILDKIGYKSTIETKTEYTKDYPSTNKIVDRITLHVSNDCNLRCKYCYASGGTYGKSRGLMTPETAKRFVDYCCDNFEKVKNIVFFGGEPFLNCPVIELVCQQFHSKFNNGDIQSIPKFGAITNGTILSPKAISLIKKYFSFITVSIDGPKEINDINRITRSGNGSFDSINQFLKRISSFPKLKISVESTYTQQHINHGYTRTMIRDYFMKEFNIKADMIDEMSLENSKTAITELDKPFDSPWFNSIMKTIVNKEPETKCQILRSIFAISTDGGIFPCHMNIGDGMKPVSSIWDSQKSLNHILKSDKSYFLKENNICSNCWAKNICGGCARLSFYDSRKKGYSHEPIEPKCNDFRHIVEKVLLKICEVRKNPKLWDALLTNVNTPNH